MSEATLTIQPRLDLGERVHELIIDCRHATTSGLLVRPSSAAGAAVFSDAAVVCAVLADHDDRERCTCTKQLRRRFGLAGMGWRAK